MFFKSTAVLALATGFAAAKPISHFHSHAHRRTNTDLTPRQSSSNAFNFIDGFNQANNQAQVLQIQEQNLQIVDNGFQQAVVSQAKEVLVINQQQNGFNNQLNNLFRKSNYQNQFPEQSTVLMVVSEIQVSVDDGRGGLFEQSVFAQSVVVANRGRGASQTVMIVAETIIAQNVLNNRNQNQDFALNNNNNNNGFGAGQAFPTGTADVQLFGARPTWSAIAEDPAAKLGAIWQAELADLNNVDFNGADNGVNEELAREEKRRLDELKAAEDEARKQEEQAKQDEQRKQDEEQKKQDEQAAQDEQKKQEEEQKKQEEQAAQDEQKKQEEEQKKQEEQAAQDEQKKQQEEQAKQEEEQKKADEEAKKQQDQAAQDEQKKKDEEEAKKQQEQQAAEGEKKAAV